MKNSALPLSFLCAKSSPLINNFHFISNPFILSVVQMGVPLHPSYRDFSWLETGMKHGTVQCSVWHEAWWHQRAILPVTVLLMFLNIYESPNSEDLKKYCTK